MDLGEHIETQIHASIKSALIAADKAIEDSKTTYKPFKTLVKYDYKEMEVMDLVKPITHVKCIHPFEDEIIKDKIYKIANELHHTYHIQAEDGVIRSYNKTRFEPM